MKDDDLFEITDLKFDGQRMTAKVKLPPSPPMIEIDFTVPEFRPGKVTQDMLDVIDYAVNEPLPEPEWRPVEVVSWAAEDSVFGPVPVLGVFEHVKPLSAKEICETQPMSGTAEDWADYEERQTAYLSFERRVAHFKAQAQVFEEAGLKDIARALRLRIQRWNNEAGR